MTGKLNQEEHQILINDNKTHSGMNNIKHLVMTGKLNQEEHQILINDNKTQE